MVSEKDKKKYKRWKQYSPSDLTLDEKNQLEQWEKELNPVKEKPKKKKRKHKTRITTIEDKIKQLPNFKKNKNRERRGRAILKKLFGG